MELPQLLCPILDFVTAVSRGGKAREWFVGGNLTALISSVFNFVQMTDEDVSRGFVLSLLTDVCDFQRKRLGQQTPTPLLHKKMM